MSLSLNERGPEDEGSDGDMVASVGEGERGGAREGAEGAVPTLAGGVGAYSVPCVRLEPQPNMPISAISPVHHYCYNTALTAKPKPKKNPALTCNFLPKTPFSCQTKTSSLTFTRPRSYGLRIVTMSYEAGVGVMGTKLGMMSYFEENGKKVMAVTVVGFREGNIVTQIKTQANEGYDAVQVGYRRVRDKKLTKPELGHLQKAGVIPLRHLQEFRLEKIDGFEVGQKLEFAELFKEGDFVDVSGTTIGKGFQGGIKRHKFKRGLMTHGSKSHRQLGSIGAGTTPGRVYKGKKMPGRMGGTNTKIKRLRIVKIDSDLGVVMIKGAVPGKPGNLLRIAPAKIVGKNIPRN
ncbi:60S ribosomal protein L3 [Turnera subulata]|uniref:Large ribosomal subunit protein uL3c n=1 Tax=Turnera subulata TaxID=218843 RepID=A0A9Q0F0H9_9ROSI|nr:60S ribosomal protein L3 [Turnera subulata]